MRGIAQEGKDMHEGRLRHRRRGISGHIPYRNSPLRTGIHVDVVHPGTGFADQPQPGCRIQQSRRHLELVDNQDIAIPNAGQALFRRRIPVSHEFAQRLQRGKRTGPEGQGIQKDNLHVTSL